MPKIPVGVSVDFSNVTVAGNQFSGNPSWTFNPGSVPVQHGHNKITWTLTATNVPSGASAMFADSNAIQFKPANQIQWTGSQPTKKSASEVEADDNFHSLSTTQTFYYNTNVTLSAPSVTAQTYTYDPDVENEAGGGR